MTYNWQSLNSLDRDYGYEYPGGLDLKPGSELHQRLLTEIMRRANESRSVIQAKEDTWRKIDMTLTTYMKMNEKEEKIKADDERKPVNVVVPMSYAIRETILTYMMAAFLDDPIFRYEGQGPEDVVGAILLEMLIARQCRIGKIGLALHTMWMDATSYGFGVVGVNYVQMRKEMDIENKEVKESFMSKLFSFIGMGGEGVGVSRGLKIISEGNELINIDPYLYLPDSNVPISEVQRGEHAGWISRSNKMNILAEERDGDMWFNAKYLHMMQNAKSKLFSEPATGRYEKYGGTGYGISNITTSPTDIVNMYIKIIPSQFPDPEYPVGRSDYPELWFFAIAGDQLIISAEKVENEHGKIPIAVTAPDTDGHTTIPVSKLETIAGLQETVDWLFKSHMHNVRKALNDVIVYDPQLIYSKDLKQPGPGGLIRLRPGAWGKGVRDAIQQLAVVDVTSQHLGEVGGIVEIARDVSGASDIMQGLRRKTSERVSAAEHTDLSQKAMSRLQRFAKLISMQAHEDIALMFASNTIQYMSEQVYVKAVGEWEQRLIDEYGIKGDKGRYPVKPSDLDINFDVIPHDGTMPSSGDAGTLVKMFQVMATQPWIGRQFDLVRVFKSIARMSGIKNLNEFESKKGINFNIQPDEQVMNQVAQGRLGAIEGGE